MPIADPNEPYFHNAIKAHGFGNAHRHAVDEEHTHAFRMFGGIPQRGIYDNMRTAIDRVGRGKERDVNARFLAMASHYLFEPEFCNPASGWEMGQVEKNVQDARYRLWQREALQFAVAPF